MPQTIDETDADGRAWIAALAASPMGGGEVDAAKDKALLDAFSQAIASAMGT